MQDGSVWRFLTFCRARVQRHGGLAVFDQEPDLGHLGIPVLAHGGQGQDLAFGGSR